MSEQKNYGDIVSNGVSGPLESPICQGDCCNQCEEEFCTWRTQL